MGLDRDGRRHWKLGHIVHICILQFVFRKLQFAISTLCTCICGAFGSQISGGEPPPTNSRPGRNVLSFRLMLVLTMSFNISVLQQPVWMLTCEIGEARSISEGMVGFANGVQCAQLPWVERDQMWDSRTMPIIKIAVLFRIV